MSTTDAVRECSHHSRPAGSPAERALEPFGYELVSPKRNPSRPRFGVRVSARGLGPRADDPSRDGAGGVLHDTRENTFRFVVCRNSIQNATALSSSVSNHWRQRRQG